MTTNQTLAAGTRKNSRLFENVSRCKSVAVEVVVDDDWLNSCDLSNHGHVKQHIDAMLLVPVIYGQNWLQQYCIYMTTIEKHFNLKYINK